MATAKKAATGSTGRTSTAGKAPATKAPAKKTTATKASATKTSAKKTSATKTPAKKTPAKKTPATKTPAKKTPAKKTTMTKAAETTMTMKSAAHAAAGDLVVGQDEEPWTEEELAEIRAELTAEVERHREQARAASADLAEMRLTAESGGDAADVGTSNFERDQELTLAAYAHEALQQTQLALEKIDRGTYGQCDNCGQPIGKGRLQVYPRATLCLTCKQREERR